MTDPIDTVVNDQLTIARSKVDSMVAKVIVKNFTNAFPADKPSLQKADLYQAYIQAKTFCAYYESLTD